MITFGYPGFALELVSQSTGEVVSTTDLKTQLRIDSTGEDDYIDGLCVAARVYVENQCHRSLVYTTWRLTLDEWPSGPIYLPRSPILAVSSVQYVDSTGGTTTWSTSGYQVDTRNEPGRVMLASAQTLPTLEGDTLNQVTVNYTAGYSTDASSVPTPLIHAIKLLVGHWYEHREDVVVGATSNKLDRAVDALISGYKVPYVW